MKFRSLLSLLLASGTVFGAELWKFDPAKAVIGKNTQVTAAGEGFKLGKELRFFARDYVNVDMNKSYTVTLYTRKTAGSPANPKVWVLMEMFGKKGQIYPAAICPLSDDLGELTAPAKVGDTVLQIKNADKWQKINSSKVLAFNAKADRSDLPNIELSTRIKSIGADGKVVLARPLKTAYPAGTLIRCHRETPPFITLMRVTAPETWKYFDTKLQGDKITLAPGKFVPGTTKIRFRVYTDGELEIKGLTFRDSSNEIQEAQKKKPLIFGKNARLELVNQAKAGKIATAYLSWWGEPDEDVTARLQDAIDSKVQKLIIDKFPAPWISEPVRLRSNLELVFDDGAEIHAKKGAYHGKSDSVLNLQSLQNVKIYGSGKPGVIKMHKADYQNPKLYSKAEWRCCVAIRGGKNILIENMRFAESGGDGIIISHNGPDFPSDIRLNKVDCDGHHRQGLSIICGRNILVENSLFRNTSGTNPESGIDIESNKNDDPINNIVIRNCESRNNTGYGIILSATRMDSNRAGKLDVTVENCRLIDNVAGDFAACTRSRWIRENEQTWGNLLVKDCVFSNDKHNSLRRYCIDMEFDIRHKLNITFDNVSLKRGPATRRAIRIAHCYPEKDFPAPGCKVVFKNLRNIDIPEAELLQFADHSFSGAADLVTGIPFTPVKYPEIPAPRYTPVSAVNFQYPNVYQVFRADFWLDCRAGNKTEFALKYASLGRRSRTAQVTVTAPDGKELRLGAINKGDVKKFAFTPEKTGFYHVKVRGGLHPKISLVSSNVPGGILADPHDMIMFDPGTIYFRVPENSQPFAVRVWGRSNVLSVKAEIFDPQGNKVYSNNLINSGIQYTPSEAEQKRAGIWKVVISKGRGYFAKYHLAFPGVLPYLGTSPECVPEIKK